MKKYRISSKIKGIARVSTANLISLGVSLITSFVLPYFISVEDYGYWQLFILYAGYVGFFSFGFNDGVHLNYATCSYNNDTAKKFHSFKTLLLAMSGVETLGLILFLTFAIGPVYGKYYTLLFAALNIIPVLVNGLFTYMNQATMRFKQYAIGNTLDKLIFAVMMVVLLIAGCKNYVFYIAAYTAARYLVIGYHFVSSKLVFTEKALPLKELKPEIYNNFTSGFALMIATLLNGSIIVGSRLLIENQFGIAEFGAYSFANHALVIASQFISAIASVFYPIMKRCKDEELEKAYGTFDKSSTLLSAALLVSFYMAVIVIHLVYKQYSSILTYFSFVYPLFIFQCKSNLLIINTYKVKGQPVKLAFRNALGIVIHLVFVFAAYYIFGTVYAIAVAVLVSYCIWYYLSQIMVCKESSWAVRKTMFLDLILTCVFIVINLATEYMFNGSFYVMTLLQCAVYVVTIVAVGLLFKGKIKQTLKELAYFLND